MTSTSKGYIGVTKGDPRIRFKQHEANDSEVMIAEGVPTASLFPSVTTSAPFLPP